MITKGALLRGIGQPWSVQDIELGEPGPGEVAVRLAAAGLCRSDHHLVVGSIPVPGFPVHGGHEGAGTISAIGAGVEALAIGDHVVLSPITTCGGCPSCQAGQRNLCDGAATPAPQLGAFSPYAVVHQTSAVKIDPAVPLGPACLLGCPVLTGYGAATRSAAIRPGQDVAVVGLGGVGMAAVQGAIIAGARRVFAIDPSEWKRDVALGLGATHGFPDVKSAIPGVADATEGRMASKVIVAVGHVEGKDVDNWLILTAKGGACVLVGLGDIAATEVTANLAINVLLQKRLQGCRLGGGNPHHDVPLLASMYLKGKLNLDALVTREYRLDQINDGFRDMLEGNLIRGIIRYTDDDWIG